MGYEITFLQFLSVLPGCICYSHEAGIVGNNGSIHDRCRIKGWLTVAGEDLIIVGYSARRLRSL